MNRFSALCALGQLHYRYAQRFTENPAAHLALSERHVLKNMVISHYTLTGMTGIAEVVALYEVDKNLIMKEWLVYG